MARRDRPAGKALPGLFHGSASPLPARYGVVRTADCVRYSEIVAQCWDVGAIVDAAHVHAVAWRAQHHGSGT